MSEMLTMAETAAVLHVSPRTIRRWVKDGTLPSVRIGRSIVRIPADAVASLGRTGANAIPSSSGDCGAGEEPA